MRLMWNDRSLAYGLSGNSADSSVDCPRMIPHDRGGRTISLFKRMAVDTQA